MYMHMYVCVIVYVYVSDVCQIIPSRTEHFAVICHYTNPPLDRSLYTSFCTRFSYQYNIPAHSIFLHIARFMTRVNICGLHV